MGAKEAFGILRWAADAAISTIYGIKSVDEVTDASRDGVAQNLDWAVVGSLRLSAEMLDLPCQIHAACERCYTCSGAEGSNFEVAVFSYGRGSKTPMFCKDHRPKAGGYYLAPQADALLRVDALLTRLGIKTEPIGHDARVPANYGANWRMPKEPDR